MNVLLINECDRYCYPVGITTLESFAKYSNAHINQLLPLYKFMTENFVHPYYIEEEKNYFIPDTLCYMFQLRRRAGRRQFERT
ncbi:MAG TPA: hypothetical protein DEP23_11740 [Ruminococcaceae bacterium]|nr:hypothetical protein [Oscillospiraceae bacterium]